MRCDDLRSYLHLLRQADQLACVPVEVDPSLELTTIVDRVCKVTGGQRALLFEHVRGSGMPVAANLFGTLERVAWALGSTDLDSLARRLDSDLRRLACGDAIAALQQLVTADA